MLRKLLYFGSSKNHSAFKPTRIFAHQKDHSPDIIPGPIFEILRYLIKNDTKFKRQYSRTHVIRTLRGRDICSNHISFRMTGS